MLPRLANADPLAELMAMDVLQSESASGTIHSMILEQSSPNIQGQRSLRKNHAVPVITMRKIPLPFSKMTVTYGSPIQVD